MLRKMCLALIATCLAANPVLAQETKPAPGGGAGGGAGGSATGPIVEDVLIQADEIRLEAGQLSRQAAEAGQRAADLAEKQLKPLYFESMAPGGKIALRALQPRTEKGPFIGVSASPVPAVLRDQLRLKPGVGLVVDFVLPDGPAAKAGLRKSDVMEKLDDQILINPQQLAVLVRTRKPGDAIKLAVIREAQPQAVTVTVAEGDVPPLDDVISSDSVVKFNKLIKPLHGSLTIPGGSAGGGGVGGIDFVPRVWRGGDNATFDMNWSDKEHSFSITQEKGVRRLDAKNKSGKDLYNGPIDTPSQLEKLPPEIREKVKKLDAKWRTAPATQPATVAPPPGGV